MTTLPPGWTCPYPDTDPTYAQSADGVDLDLDAEDLRIEWTEGCDDHYGTTTRACSIPTALVRALLPRLDGLRIGAEVGLAEDHDRRGVVVDSHPERGWLVWWCREWGARWHEAAELWVRT